MAGLTGHFVYKLGIGGPDLRALTRRLAGGTSMRGTKAIEERCEVMLSIAVAMPCHAHILPYRTRSKVFRDDYEKGGMGGI
jgi:hypothetical protein